VLGNTSDQDVRATITALPRLCVPKATVIWTRTRRVSDLTPTVCRWFAGAGSVERVFHAPPGVFFSVGVHQLHRWPGSPPRSGRIFTFLK
jgi:hypothetical protein